MIKLQTKIFEYRRELNMTQAELAEKVDIRRETVARLERGQYNPSLKLANDIAQVFGARIEDIFQFVDVPDSSEE